MTTKELIEILSKYPDDTPVKFSHLTGTIWELEHIEDGGMTARALQKNATIGWHASDLPDELWCTFCL
jgi:hypothetical protein